VALLERFDAQSVLGVSVVPRPDGGYLLAYCGARGPGDTDYQIALATSTDGLSWQRPATHGPALTLGRAPHSTYLAGVKSNVAKAFIVVGAMALGLGLVGLVKLHGGKIIKHEKNRVYSVGFFIALVITLYVAFSWGGDDPEEGGTGYKLFSILFNGMLRSFGASSMGLLTFYLASSSYRSFKLKSAEAGLMMLAAVLVMLGQVPLGQMLTSWLPEHLQIQSISRLMSSTIVNPVMRAIQIGAAVGGLVLATRLWLSLDKKR